MTLDDFIAGLQALKLDKLGAGLLQVYAVDGASGMSSELSTGMIARHTNDEDSEDNQYLCGGPVVALPEGTFYISVYAGN